MLQPANSRRISGRRFSPSEKIAVFGGREATTGNASAVRRLLVLLLFLFVLNPRTCLFLKSSGGRKMN